MKEYTNRGCRNRKAALTYIYFTLEESRYVVVATIISSHENYNLDNLFIDRFWNNITDNKWIYLDNKLILWLGYKELNKGKENIIRILKKYNKEKTRHP